MTEIQKNRRAEMNRQLVALKPESKEVRSAPLFIPGILIEGTDYVGKTTITNLLEEHLTERNASAFISHCYMSQSPLVRRIEQEAKKCGSMEERDWYYSAAIAVDLDLLVMRPPTEFAIQDRHWFSQLGRNLFFHPHAKMLPSNFFDDRRTIFSFSFYLTSSLEAKKERARGREPTSPRDTYLKDNPTAHQEYDQFCISLLPKNENWIVVDTTERSPRQVLEIIQNTVGKMLPAGPLGEERGESEPRGYRAPKFE